MRETTHESSKHTESLESARTVSRESKLTKIRLVSKNMKNKGLISIPAIMGMMAMALAMTIASSASALADAPAPGWEVFGRFGPTDLVPGGRGDLYLYVYDVGAEVSTSPVKIVARLPVGRTAGSGSACGGEGTEVATCEIGPGSLPPNGKRGRPVELAIPVTVSPNAPKATTSIDRIEVMGGGAVGVSKASVPVRFGSTLAPFGFSNFDGWLSNADGTTNPQAGSHPYELTMAFSLPKAFSNRGRQLDLRFICGDLCDGRSPQRD